jgi:uncharacterized membrane protein YagU involved in acid resistance
MPQNSKIPTNAPIQFILRTIMTGLISTTAMTILMELLYTRLPRDEQYPLPPEEIATVAEVKILGKPLDAPQHITMTLTSHFGYGIGLAGVFSIVADHLPFPPLFNGIFYGLAVWAVSYMGWLPAFKVLRPATEFPSARNRLMIFSHAIWGAILGTLTSKSES